MDPSYLTMLPSGRNTLYTNKVDIARTLQKVFQNLDLSLVKLDNGGQVDLEIHTNMILVSNPIYSVTHAQVAHQVDHVVQPFVQQGPHGHNPARDASVLRGARQISKLFRFTR